MAKLRWIDTIFFHGAEKINAAAHDEESDGHHCHDFSGWFSHWDWSDIAQTGEMIDLAQWMAILFTNLGTFLLIWGHVPPLHGVKRRENYAIERPASLSRSTVNIKSATWPQVSTWSMEHFFVNRVVTNMKNVIQVYSRHKALHRRHSLPHARELNRKSRYEIGSLEKHISSMVIG
jgi:hypothetical protein